MFFCGFCVPLRCWLVLKSVGVRLRLRGDEKVVNEKPTVGTRLRTDGVFIYVGKCMRDTFFVTCLMIIFAISGLFSVVL